MEVCTVLELRERYIVGIRAEGGDDCGAQVGEGGGVAGEKVEEPGKERGGGVAACAEDVESFGAEDEGVGSLFC